MLLENQEAKHRAIIHSLVTELSWQRTHISIGVAREPARQGAKYNVAYMLFNKLIVYILIESKVPEDEGIAWPSK